MAGSRRPSTWACYRILLAKDLRHELRTHEMLTSMGLYSVLVLIVFGVAFSQAGVLDEVPRLAGGLVWVLVVFTSLLGLGRSFSFEKEAGALEALLLVPMDRSVIYLAKLTSNFIFLSCVELVVLPLFYFFFMTGADPAPTFPLTVAPVVCGSAGIASVGTLLSSITVDARARDVLLAVCFIPLSFPLLYACVAATTAALSGGSGWFDSYSIAMVMTLAYDIVMTLVAWVLYDYVIGS